jgi:aconitate hydratase
MYAARYGHVLEGDEHWKAVSAPTGDRFDWDPKSTYVRKPPYFDGMPPEPTPRTDIVGARVLALLGDSVTTDHISPAGNIRKDGAAGRYLIDGGVQPDEFNSYGARRGNHEVMIRGTFGNARLRNQLAPGTEGSFTVHLPDGEAMSIYDASMRYQRDGVPLVVLAGKEYGSGSSRDWAAKGAALLGVKAVLAESFERIHRSNLIGMGVLPLELPASFADLGLTGHEVFDIRGVAGTDPIPRRLTVEADGTPIEVTVRIDTPKEQEYYRHGGILQYVLRQMVS